MANKKVLVMMATYNGAVHLAEQIDSILSQQGVDVTLRVCDDRSEDETIEILKKYAGDKQVLIQRNRKRLGVGMNFMQMVYEADPQQFDFFAFSDQDDVWLPEKLDSAIQSIEAYERDGAKRIGEMGTPILYCSDLLDVDEHLHNPTRELNRLRGIEQKRASLLIRNIYSGCTTVFNREHLRLAQLHPVEDYARIHDAWMALLAYYCGNLLVNYDDAFIMRRITGRNVAGATVPGSDVKRMSFSRLFKRPERAVSRSARQLLAYEPYMAESDRCLVSSLAEYPASFSGRLRWVFSREYRSLSGLETFLVRVKFLFARY